MSSAEQGPSSAEAAQRLAAFGSNEPVPVRRLSVVVQRFRLFANPHVIIAASAAGPDGATDPNASNLVFHRAGAVHPARRDRLQAQRLPIAAVCPGARRPSRALTLITLAIVVIGAVLPATPLAAFLGFTRLPLSYFAFLIPATLAYLVMVEAAKRQLVRRLGLGS